MGRPKLIRKMNLPPAMLGFRPFGIPIQELESVNLLLEEFESIRLTDNENLTQEEVAVIMGVSRPTLTRIYDKARKIVANALAENKVIFISGGNVEFDEEWYKCNQCNETFVIKDAADENCINCDSKEIKKVGEEQPKENNTNSYHEHNKMCYCVDCGIELTHKSGIPCRAVKCPYCDKSMTGIKLKK